MKRMIFRVGHYKSDAALQSEWEVRLAAGNLPVMPGKPPVHEAQRGLSGQCLAVTSLDGAFAELARQVHPITKIRLEQHIGAAGIGVDQGLLAQV